MGNKVAKRKLIIIAAFLLVILLNHSWLTTGKASSTRHFRQDATPISSTIVSTISQSSFQDFASSMILSDDKLLPIPQSHPLPISLANWTEPNNKEDYFKQIKPSPNGYLIWSRFPVKIYLEKSKPSLPNSAENKRQKQWLEAVRKAIAEWDRYLPLQEIDNPELANIIVTRSTPTREVKINPETGLYDLPRAITARTTYQFYWQENKVLYHRMDIQVSPNLSKLAILAATRHELGHALGIWGHSLDRNDALYFSQVRNFPPISARDINTLKKIYQQPTRLGWLGKEKAVNKLD
ncbi:MAG: peptidase [Xenococcaceae cyanobacterium]